ncbi:MAG: prolipoprotein diacylglyceryl transferase [Nanoarchaeota archaeon]|nr:prolipoprotein diacylglyceryl transferase [Nanoarchaeota archaeon]
MIDLHTHPENWGIKPVLFSFGKFEVSSYSFFVLLGLCVGLVVYYLLAKRNRKVSEKSFYILITGLGGGVLGAKIPIWIINFPLIIQSYPDITPILSGRTITGGLIGGTLAVMYIKKKLKIKEKKGNLFAPAIALGVAIGRIGCFLQGCCYGIQTNLPWGVDFGDGILRHPTQLYESVFMLGMFFVLLYKSQKTKKGGYLYYILMNSYFIFRFFEEFIKENPRYLDLTLFHYISLAALLFINGKYLYEKGYIKKKWIINQWIRIKK